MPLAERGFQFIMVALLRHGNSMPLLQIMRRTKHQVNYKSACELQTFVSQVIAS